MFRRENVNQGYLFLVFFLYFGHITWHLYKNVHRRLSKSTEQRVTFDVKGKAVPLQAWSGQRFPGIKVPRLHDNDTGWWSALHTGRLCPREILLVLICVRGLVDPGATVRSKGLFQWKLPMTPTGIEPTTFRFVAQHLNHCAAAVSNFSCNDAEIKWCPTS